MICRWLFYIKGGITILVAVCVMFILPGFRQNTVTKWFTPEERAIIISRLAEDGYGKADKLGKQTTMKGLRDVVVFGRGNVPGSRVVFLHLFPNTVRDTGIWHDCNAVSLRSSMGIRGKSHLAQIRYSDTKQRRYKCFVALGTLAFIMSILRLPANGFTVSGIAGRESSLLYSETYRFLMAQAIAGYLVLLAWISSTFFREPAKRVVAITR
ncbi:uncharacterized protein HD556DRAFT_1492571 [Suillus plorans]|uniref:Uncharacterized protein n=1 Tax=Suillus plorans TaxID=116603 RepID=A0A9P7AHT0_9AGAM|nr:uncharacterized protein HD556DRAFT_1492571 [Suillus plorans]KAG1789760.1 hypothetical protein HD556DRAFT_1492571 [Suillus plorans]